MFLRKCETCKLYIPNEKTCQIMAPIMKNKILPQDFCSKYTNTIYQCEVCGVGILWPVILTIDGINHTYCENCIMTKIP